MHDTLLWPPRRIGQRWEATRAPRRYHTARAIIRADLLGVSPASLLSEAQCDKSNRLIPTQGNNYDAHPCPKVCSHAFRRRRR